MRVARIILIVVVVLGGLFVAADRIAVSVAEKKAAQRAQATEGLSSRPKVSIEGFPFLTQAASGKLEDVKISADDIAATSGGQSVRIDSFHADLHGVKLSGNYSRAVADSADGNASISYDDLTAAAPHGITVSYAGKDQDGKPMVKLTGSFDGAHLSVLSEVSVRGADTIGLHAKGLPKVFTALGIEKDVRQEIDFTTQLSHLPANIALTTVTTDPDGITVDASGKDVVLAD
jgi:LmeA-like phospholipid-binding